MGRSYGDRYSTYVETTVECGYQIYTRRVDESDMITRVNMSLLQQQYSHPLCLLVQLSACQRHRNLTLRVEQSENLVVLRRASSPLQDVRDKLGMLHKHLFIKTTQHMKETAHQ